MDIKQLKRLDEEWSREAKSMATLNAGSPEWMHAARRRLNAETAISTFCQDHTPEIIALSDRVARAETQIKRWGSEGTARALKMAHTEYIMAFDKERDAPGTVAAALAIWEIETEKVSATNENLADRVEFLEKGPLWIAFEKQRPVDRQPIFLAWRWKSAKEWSYAHALFIHDEDGYYFVHAQEVAEHWVVEENLDDAEFFWQAESIPLKEQAEVRGC